MFPVTSQILDPPGSDLPPVIKKYTDRDDNDNDDSTENRKAINWGEEIPEGDLSAFVALGPNARVNFRSFYSNFYLFLFYIFCIVN